MAFYYYSQEIWRIPGISRLDPIRSPRRVLLSETFNVEGDNAEIASVKSSLSHQMGDRSFTLEVRKNELSADDYILKFKARDAWGNPLTLRPVMGAHAHLVAFRLGKKRVCSSPSIGGRGNHWSVTDSTTNDLEFAFNSSRIPSCRLWAQVLLENDKNETFIPFTIN